MTVEEKIKKATPGFEQMPGIVVIHDMNGFKPIFMTRKGLDLLGLSLEELKAIGEDYQNLFFNRDFMGSYLDQLNEMIAREGNDETFTFFHEVRIQDVFKWYAASIKVFHTSDSKPTHSITYAVPLDEFPWTTKRAAGLLYEKSFAQKNLKKFSSLSSREKEVLAFSAIGNKAGEIAEELRISPETVNSHIKSLKQKLGTTSSYELLNYARAYDLI